MDIAVGATGTPPTYDFKAWLAHLDPAFPDTPMSSEIIQAVIATYLNKATRNDLLERLIAHWGGAATLKAKGVEMWRLRLKVALLDNASWQHPAFRV